MVGDQVKARRECVFVSEEKKEGEYVFGVCER